VVALGDFGDALLTYKTGGRKLTCQGYSR
jgi:hypothetical protein